MNSVYLWMAQTDLPAVHPATFEKLTPPLQVALFLGTLSFATAALISLTAFTRIIIVLSFVRKALATSEIPPNQVIMGLSIFLTFFVMAPTFETIYKDGVEPYLAAQQQENPDKDIMSVAEVAARELHAFMRIHTRKSDLALFVELSDSPTSITVDEIPLKVLIPAFIISELKTSFIMGFCIYIPFLLIDLVMSTVLMSLGMMMMPPVVVSTPCKLLLFVLVDGWHLISRAIVTSFGT
ncbi:MAG TPA: flagellar type III secretion system pore protein FliP [Pirellulaceae bacterium]|nr:flagellar type III secretion system pore protein FliP [Pirellulaceae bacterium]